MPAKNTPDDQLLDILIVDKPNDMKLIFSEKHNMVLKLVTETELSISDISRKLNMNPGSVHYHLKELEKHGLVRQVREEIKGGTVRKYYRSVAKRILLESPNFNSQTNLWSDRSPDYTERLIRAIEFLGYHLPPENAEDAKEMLQRYDKRIKALILEIQDTGLSSVENNGLVLDNAIHLILSLKAKDDPELGRIYDEFGKLFLKYE